MKTLLLALALLSVISVQASTVAVIDSGTDMLHKDIEPQAWINAGEIPRNDRDEDRNGYQDDVNGWNFAEGNAEVIDYSYLGTLTFDVRRFFEIQTKFFLNTATDEEVKWMRAKVEDQDFLKSLGIYGNFMHGTHVGGISVKNSPEAKLLAVKLIPTEVKLPGQKQNFDKGLGMFLLKQALGLLATQQMTMMKEIASYIDNHKADIANGSFGTGYPQSKMIVEMLGKVLIKDITPEQIEEATMHFLTVMLKEGEHMVVAAPNTLFVFAAGNDGLNNDKFPISPTNIEAVNVISVAATLGDKHLASFSNYGIQKVDIAAPGVGIESTVPGNQYLEVSGTSQAAPYVTNIASRMKDANKELMPRDLKKILMKTVDLRDYLKGKVASEGIVNTSRAVRAAELTRTMSVDAAIKVSIQEIKDLGKDISVSSKVDAPKGFVLPLPSNFVIK